MSYSNRFYGARGTLFACLVLCFMEQAGAVHFVETFSSVTVANRFVECVVTTKPFVQIASLSGDYYGESKYGDNTLASQGIRLEWEDNSGTIHWNDSPISANYTVEAFESCVIVTFPKITDCGASPSISESWVLKLCDDQRAIIWTTAGAVLRDISARSIRHAAYARPLSITAFYESGVVQMLSAAPQRSHFGSTKKLHRVYAVGVQSSLDMNISTSQSVLLNSDGSLGFYSGMQELLAGSPFTPADVWTSSWEEVPAQVIQVGTSWTSLWLLSPTQLNFPSLHLPPSPAELSEENRRDAYNIAAMMTGIYTNAAGCLCTYPNEVTQGYQVNQIATSLREDDCK